MAICNIPHIFVNDLDWTARIISEKNTRTQAKSMWFQILKWTPVQDRMQRKAKKKFAGEGISAYPRTPLCPSWLRSPAVNIQSSITIHSPSEHSIAGPSRACSPGACRRHIARFLGICETPKQRFVSAAILGTAGGTGPRTAGACQNAAMLSWTAGHRKVLRYRPGQSSNHIARYD